MSSGLQWNEDDYFVHPESTDPWLMDASSNFVDYMLAKPLACAPGACWHYSSGDSMLLSGIIQAATGLSAYEFARQNLLEPIGLENIEWWSDPSGHTIGGWGIQATVRELAKFGLLYLHNGQWDGQQVVPEAWVAASTQPASKTITHYGYQWWFPSWRSYYWGEHYQAFNIPERTYFAMGVRGQFIIVVPEHNLVVVRVGNDQFPSDLPLSWHELRFLSFIIDAIE
jgi:CubicO group peptidase (beta-lactamase class C family)